MFNYWVFSCALFSFLARSLLACALVIWGFAWEAGGGVEDQILQQAQITTQTYSG